jgi:transcriptional regulator with XRE-family HTH domain
MSTFGQELRRRRQEAALSLSQFAARVHYSKGYLSKIESERMSVSVTFARLCDAALDAGGSLIALAASARTEQSDVQADDSSSAFPAFTLEGLEWARTLQPALFRATADLGHPDAAVALFETRLHHARLLGDLINAAMTLPLLIAETHVLRGLAAKAGEAPVAHQLWRLAARYAELTGRMSQETGDDQQALWWTKAAATMAARGGSPDLEYYMLLRNADMALQRDDPLQALELTHNVQATPSLAARTYACAAQREAQAHALLGDSESCLRALDRASALLEEAHTGSGLADENVADDSVALTHGWALFDLGQPTEAAAVLEDVLAQTPPDRVRGRTRLGVRRALAYAAAGDISRACQVIDELLPDIQQLDSATIRHDLRLLTRELRRSASLGEVRDLLPALAEATRPGRQP